jgi:hypothetical protein
MAGGDKMAPAAKGWLDHSIVAERGLGWSKKPTFDQLTEAGALGGKLPSRDLLLSPDHTVSVGGALIPIRHLINGSTIVQEPIDEVTYYHVELETHDVVVAEGLPCESYLDTGNRAAFNDSLRDRQRVHCVSLLMPPSLA